MAKIELTDDFYFFLCFSSTQTKAQKNRKLVLHVFLLSHSAVQSSWRELMLARIGSAANVYLAYILPTRGFHTLAWPLALCASPRATLGILQLTLSWLLSLLINYFQLIYVSDCKDISPNTPGALPMAQLLKSFHWLLLTSSFASAGYVSPGKSVYIGTSPTLRYLLDCGHLASKPPTVSTYDIYTIEQVVMLLVF